MSNKTAMQQLLHQMREERTKLPLPIEWDRAYQAIEMVIETTYIPLEKEQIVDAWNGGDYAYFYSKETGRDFADGEEYYKETYKGGQDG